MMSVAGAVSESVLLGSLLITTLLPGYSTEMLSSGRATAGGGEAVGVVMVSVTGVVEGMLLVFEFCLLGFIKNNARIITTMPGNA